MPQTKHTTQEQIEEMRRELLQEKQKMQGIRVQKRSRAKKPRKGIPVLKVAGWVVFLFIVLLLVANLVIIQTAKSRGEVPVLMGGFRLFAVESGSMEPTLGVGSLILCRTPEDAKSLKKDDIVTFRTLTGFTVTHRIVEVVAGEDGGVSYRTKGDNPVNSVDEEPLTPDRVVAVFVAKIPLT